MRADLPSGTVTFLFTDIEGSTKLLHELGAEAYAEALAEHRRVLREAFTRQGGVEVDTQGDALFVAFPTASGALQAAAEAQRALSDGPIRVRMGIHTGTPHLSEEGYVGEDVHKGARIAAAGHGGQVLVSKDTRELPGVDVDLTDLGEHRLKDFDGPVWIFQLGSERFPPLKTISNTNLPRPASSFVGREREVSEVASLLSDGTRLLSLTGPGGTGKTRLAVEAAVELVPTFKNGVFWVPLAPLRDPDLVAETIAQTLGTKVGLTEYVGEREMLLVLDNFEQVVEAAPEVAALVEACPNLKLLVTSREILRVRGEVEFPVPPLDIPEAVELFCARSQLPPDDAIAELARALDNLPLAIELAAARTSILSPAQILERLSQRLDLLKGGRDAEARQATLRATIAWSHDLLTKEEKGLFAQLAVFRGGCTLEAAEEVCSADPDTMQSLVDKSLVRHRYERFWMLETIREFATEQLDTSGEADEIGRRHAEFYVALAETAFPNMRGNPKEWLDRLDHEHDNIRAALDWLEASGETELALRLAGAASRFWYLRAYFAEGRRRLESVLSADERPTAARGRALNGAAVMAANSGDIPAARRWAEEGLDIHRALDDAWGAAYSIYMLAFMASEENDFSRAKPLFEESLRAFRELGDEHYTLLAIDGLSWTYEEFGDPGRRRAMLEDVLLQARAQSNEGVTAIALGQLASFARNEGRIEEALSMLRESLRIGRDLGDRGAIHQVLGSLARTLAVAERSDVAAVVLSGSDALREEIGAHISCGGEGKNARHTPHAAQRDRVR
jgi:predicted ATPase/class 3 adenylate cyclase